MIDFCANSVTLTQEEKSFANSRLNGLADTVRESAKRSPVPINVYIGGSLALKEPALEMENGKPLRVYSDMDIFVTVRHKDDIPHAAYLVKDTHGYEPEIDRTFHFIPLESTNTKAISCSVDDLIVGLREPVIEQFQLPEKPEPIRHTYAILALFVSKFTFCSLPYSRTSHLITEGNESNLVLPHKMDTLKMVLNGLRTRYYGKIPGAHGLAYINRLVNDGLFDGLLERNVISGLLYHREHYEPKNLSIDIDAPGFTDKVFKKYFDLDNNAGNMDILERLSKTLFANAGPFSDSGLTLTAYAFYAANPIAENRTLVSRCLSRIDVSASVFPEELKQAMIKARTLLEKGPGSEEGKDGIAPAFAELHANWLRLITSSIIADH